MSSIWLFVDGSELRPCVAGLDALVPRVINIRIPSTSTVSEPRTAATATTSFAGFLDGATFGASEPDGRRCGCWCLYLIIGFKETRNKNAWHALISRVLTCY